MIRTLALLPVAFLAALPLPSHAIAPVCGVAVPAAPATRSASVTPVVPGKCDMLQLDYDSALLGRRVSNLVWIPASHGSHKLTVAYYLHDEVTAPAASVRPQIEAFWVAARRPSDRWLVVAPDAGATAWCASCGWIDARDDGVPAERVLIEELMPIVERIFRAKSDRVSRALLGEGMGGTGALTIGFRHPDRFGVVAGLAAELDAVDALANNTLATGMELLVSPASGVPDAQAATRVSAMWTQRGVAHTALPAGAAAATFAAHVAPRLARTFGGALPEPPAFSYSSHHARFSVWGYDVVAGAANVEQPVRLLGASRDGRDVTLAGAGEITVTTPAAFAPGGAYTLTLTADPRDDEPRAPGEIIVPLRRTVLAVHADAAGHITYTASLGPAVAPAEREVLARAGRFSTRHVRAEIAAATDGAPASDPSTRPLYLDPDALSAPFDGWNVQVEIGTYGNPQRSPQILRLTFDSPAVGAASGEGPVRTRNYIYLPDRYLTDAAPLPVVYYLHGTGSGLGNIGSTFSEHLRTSDYVVVALDAAGDAESWCKQCQWIDTLQARPDELPNPWVVANRFTSDNLGNGSFQRKRMAEAHLFDEVIPLVETLFRVRSDRAGRGLLGNSMGAVGSLIQGFRHPDRFAFVGSIGGLAEFTDPAQDVSEIQWFSYMSFQGYPHPLTNPAPTRNVNPDDLAAQLAPRTTEILLSNGDTCLDDGPNCVGPDTTNTGVYTEFAERRGHDRAIAGWNELGLAHSYATHAGLHYYPNVRVYREYFIPRINATFSRPPPPPAVIFHKSMDFAFSTWGYELAVERPNREFLHLLGARSDGSDFTLAGSGEVTVHTPPAFEPGAGYQVAVTPDGAAQQLRVVAADAEGRLTLRLELAPPRALDERRELVEAGLFSFPHTRVEVLDVYR